MITIYIDDNFIMEITNCQKKHSPNEVGVFELFSYRTQG